MNANQMFKWFRAFARGELFEPCALLPVSVATPGELASKTRDRSAGEQTTSGGTIHIELPGGAMIWVESGSDPPLLCSILESFFAGFSYPQMQGTFHKATSLCWSCASICFTPAGGASAEYQFRKVRHLSTFRSLPDKSRELWWGQPRPCSTLST